MSNFIDRLKGAAVVLVSGECQFDKWRAGRWLGTGWYYPPPSAQWLPSRGTEETCIHILKNCNSTAYLVWNMRKATGEPTEEMEGRG